MTLPKVTINELDGALGVLPSSAGRLLAVLGVSSGGTANQPATFARVRDVQTAFLGGPLVEAAAHMIEAYGSPVLCIKAAAASSPGASVSSVAASAAGTAVVTVASGAAPIDDYDLVLKVLKGGTVGTAGITYALSLDGGRTFGPTTALGTATTATFPDAAGVSFDIAAGTLLAGDQFAAQAKCAQWDTAGLTAALNALRDTAVRWELLHVVGPVDAAAVDQLNLSFAGMFALGKYHGFVANTRVPDPGETEAAYHAALDTALSAKSSKWGSVYAGATRIVSSVSGRQYDKPVAFVTAPREASVSEEVDIADVNLGALPCSIRDKNGNPLHHDEAVSPGLDDLRFGTLRTWNEDPQGVYVTRPRCFSASGSDFQLLPHRRVINLGHEALRAYFVRRLNKPILVSRTTGFILESEALEIEKGANAVLRAVLLTKPKASAARFVLSRTDNLLSTKTLTGQGRITPLAYPEFINLDVGYFNPSLTLVAA